MGKKLFIIGNGFDLFHGLPTAYSDLREYFIRPIEYHDWFGITPDAYYLNSVVIMDDLIMDAVFEDWDISEKRVAVNIDKSAPLNKIHNKILKRRGIPVVDKTFLWSDFEGVLGRIDFSEYLKDDEYGSYRIKNAFRSLQSAFQEWINSIDISSVTPNLSFKQLIDYTQDLFLTFNYTDTLEQVYNVPIENICHIHGKCGEELIFGHSGLNENDFLSKNAISGFEDFAEEIFDDFTKKDKKILKTHKQFFDRFADVEEIYIMGFSFSSCDLRYIDEICHRAIMANWHFNSFDSEERRKNYAKIIRTFGAKGNIENYDLAVEKRKSIKQKGFCFGKIVKSVIRSWVFKTDPLIERMLFGFDPKNERKFFVKPYSRSILCAVIIFLLLVFSIVIYILVGISNIFHSFINKIREIICKKKEK